MTRYIHKETTQRGPHLSTSVQFMRSLVKTIGLGCKVVKNKIAPPFRLAEFDMMHTNGISYEGDVLDLGVEHLIVTRSGSWFRYGESHLGQGKEKARQFLLDNPHVTQEIRDKVLAAGGYGIDEDTEEDSSAEADSKPAEDIAD